MLFEGLPEPFHVGCWLVWTGPDGFQTRENSVGGHLAGLGVVIGRVNGVIQSADLPSDPTDGSRHPIPLLTRRLEACHRLGPGQHEVHVIRHRRQGTELPQEPVQVLRAFGASQTPSDFFHLRPRHVPVLSEGPVNLSPRGDLHAACANDGARFDLRSVRASDGRPGESILVIPGVAGRPSHSHPVFLEMRVELRHQFTPALVAQVVGVSPRCQGPPRSVLPKAGREDPGMHMEIGFTLGVFRMGEGHHQDPPCAGPHPFLEGQFPATG